MPVSAGGCRYHIILPALQSGGLGQSYHIRVTSERSIPIRAQPRNWRPLSTAILGQRGTAECSHCSLQAIQLSLCTEMHPFTEKEAIIAVKKTLNADMSQNRAKSAQLVFVLPSTGVGHISVGQQRRVAVLQFRFYAAFHFPCLRTCNLLLLATCPASRVVAKTFRNNHLNRQKDKQA